MCPTNRHSDTMGVSRRGVTEVKQPLEPHMCLPDPKANTVKGSGILSNCFGCSAAHLSSLNPHINALKHWPYFTYEETDRKGLNLVKTHSS
jgi:hypothetical protein